MQLENLRQKRNALRTRSEDVKGWAGGGGGGSAPLSARQLGPDAAVLAAAARRRQQAYALSSSSSSSDCEEGPGGASEAAPTSQELTAKLFAKLGIKGGGGGRAVGFDSDSSWASSPERSARIKAVAPGSAAPDGSSGSCGGEASHLHAQLEQAQGTIAALQQEVAAARVQADSATQQLRAAESYAQDLEVSGTTAGMGARGPGMCWVPAGCQPGGRPALSERTSWWPPSMMTRLACFA